MRAAPMMMRAAYMMACMAIAASSGGLFGCGGMSDAEIKAAELASHAEAENQQQLDGDRSATSVADGRSGAKISVGAWSLDSESNIPLWKGMEGKVGKGADCEHSAFGYQGQGDTYFEFGSAITTVSKILHKYPFAYVQGKTTCAHHTWPYIRYTLKSKWEGGSRPFTYNCASGFHVVQSRCRIKIVVPN